MVDCKLCKWLARSPSGFYFCLQQEDTNEENENILIELPIRVFECDDPCDDWEAI